MSSNQPLGRKNGLKWKKKKKSQAYCKQFCFKHVGKEKNPIVLIFSCFQKTIRVINFLHPCPSWISLPEAGSSDSTWCSRWECQEASSLGSSTCFTEVKQASELSAEWNQSFQHWLCPFLPSPLFPFLLDFLTLDLFSHSLPCKTAHISKLVT